MRGRRLLRTGKHNWYHTSRAMTLNEVLVVMGIIAFLIALLVPSLNGARELSRRLHCSNSLRQWGIAERCYRDDYDDYLPTEGTYLGSDKPNQGINKPDAWYNQLPPYLGAPAYKDVQRKGKLIVEFPRMHVWICPSKTLTPVYKSLSGKNQFHYGMNQVLDGLGKEPDGSKDTPGFFDGYYYGTDEMGGRPISARLFSQPANTVFMFDIAGNSMAGTQRSVATMYQRGWDGSHLGKFHGDYANILYLDGRVSSCTTDDLVTNQDHVRGDMIWTRPGLYWGYKPPPPKDEGD
ncbi:MAG: type II secretion system protein [Planctomycetota bacterium]